MEEYELEKGEDKTIRLQEKLNPKQVAECRDELIMVSSGGSEGVKGLGSMAYKIVEVLVRDSNQREITMSDMTQKDIENISEDYIEQVRGFQE